MRCYLDFEDYKNILCISLLVGFLTYLFSNIFVGIIVTIMLFFVLMIVINKLRKFQYKRAVQREANFEYKKQLYIDELKKNKADE